MTEKRIQFNNVLQNQLPAYVKEEFPLVAEFLKQYYISQEFQGSSNDLIQNIDQYIKLDELKRNSDSTTLKSNISFFDETITVESTLGFPDSYGLIQIDDEIITYREKKQNKIEGTATISVGSTIVYYSGLSEDYIGREFIFKDAVTDLDGKQVENLIIEKVYPTYFELSSIAIVSTASEGYNENNSYDFEISNPQFSGCIRGFSGVVSYKNTNVGIASTSKLKSQDQLIFKQSESSDHVAKNESGEFTKVINLSSLFLKEFFNKIKYQLTPGFEDREFYTDLDKYFFIKQSKDFYSTRGTDLSFKILFKALYGEDVKVIKPQDYLIKPSDAQYEITNDLVIEPVDPLVDNPYELENSTLYQDQYFDISKGYAPITKVEKIFSDTEKDYFKLSFDAGYNRDIRVDGALYGSFSVHPKTKLIGQVSSGSNTLDVDSTVGFPQSGELSVTYSDGTKGTVTYTSKNISQFFGCENITNTISDKSDVWLNVYAYGKSNIDQNKNIKVRITSVLKEVDIVDDTYYQEKGGVGVINNLGVNLTDVVSNNWFFNISKNIEISNINLLTGDTYELISKTDHNLRVGDGVKLISSDSSEISSKVIKINSSNNFQISGQGSIDVNRFYSVQRLLKKVDSEKYSYLTNQLSDVQNVYNIKDRTLIASTSLPFYDNQKLESFDRSVSFSGTFVGDIFTFYSNQDHGFYTGDCVYYLPDSTSILEEGVYYVARVNSEGDITNTDESSTRLKFAKSRASLYEALKNTSSESKFISFENEIISNGKLIEYDFYNTKSKTQKKLDSQKILREISSPLVDGREYFTNPGTTGILINGVEILNYKSKDKIYYGPIEDISVVNSGQEYDIINPPVLTISDSVGTGATGYCAVKGSLQSIQIIDPGFDYLEVPRITITGGNGFGAKASPVMKLIDHQVSFNSEQKSALVNITNNTIGFSTYHKFRNCEKIVYRTEGQKSIGGISTNSLYYVSTQNPYTIKLHKTFEDCISGINTISLTSYGTGNHILESYNKKSVIASINVENSGENYENKKRTATSEDVNIYLGEIKIKGHDFKSGEIVNYSTDGSVISGLTNDTNYYITVVDANRFKLSLVGVGSDNKDFYYQTKQYIELTTTGSGTHIFNYPEISVEILGKVGISSINSDLFTAKVQPIFRGEITSIHLKDGGIGYGSSEILNFRRDPVITLNSGSGANLVPVINNGKIVDVLINNSGQGYNSVPNLSILTNGQGGSGAVLTPILENGQIKSVKIIESGSGYNKNSTFISVTAAGIRAELNPKLKTWTVNLFQKYLNNIKNDDGIIFYNPNSNYELQFTHLYAPRKLRENIHPKDDVGKIIYGKNDLSKDIGGNELLSDNKSHSPIIGWAYDGNPIYGPYGYSRKNGGIVTRMKSGYQKIDSQSDRPSSNIFPLGFFVEDYEYKNVDDDSVLDEYNGRFCITPDFPKGIYAYFATIEEESSESFNGYKLPEFPFLIGNKFKSIPNSFNFDRSSNQDDINLNETNWIRNTTLHDISNLSYPYVDIPNKLKQTIDVKYALPGSIESVGVITGGDNYKVNDKVLFNDEGTQGFGFFSKVSKIQGKEINSISIASTTTYSVEINPEQNNKDSFIIQSNSPHGLLNGDIISLSGLSTTSSLFDSTYVIKVFSNVFSISDPFGVSDVSTTGIVTYIPVSGNIGFLNIKENDIFTVGNEKIKILNIDNQSSRIRVLRSIDGTVGSAHSYGDVLQENSRRFSINSKNFISYTKKLNKEIYFDPLESLGIGTIYGVGIVTTLSFSNPGVGITQISIPTKTIYLPNHNLDTGDELTYSSNGGTEISVSNNGVVSVALSEGSSVYVAKISNDLIGISTVRVGLGSTGIFVGIGSTTSSISTLYFTGVGTNTYHSLKTNYPKLTANVYKNTVTVSTTETHGLTNNDYVFVDVKSGITTTIVVKYNDFNRRLLINPRSFSAVGVNTTDNSITIENHNFKNGQKVVYTSDSPSSGLINDKIYYIVVFDRDIIKLSPSYYSATSSIPSIVNINSTSDGTLSPINPPIEVYKNSTINFDLSDSSLSYLSGSERYSAFDFNFYTDSNYTQIFDSTVINNEFEIQKQGTIGIDNNARISLKVTDNIPQKLFYKLDKVFVSGIDLPAEKDEIQIDYTVSSNNEIQVKNSQYSGEHKITSIGSSSFTYNIPQIPEKNSYTSSNSTLTYETTSLSAFGPISEIKITSKGQNYYSLPDFITVSSSSGSGAILEVSSNSVGRIKKTKINDIGYNFPSDFTLKPNLSLPQILKIEPLNSFEMIGISSFGKGYLTPPKLIVIDGKTKSVLSEVDLRYSLGDTEVEILNNTYRLNDIDPIIIPTQNSNGVGISSISFNSTTKDVTVSLSVGYSTESSFPFSVGDKILIENISIGINSEGKGYNSENYNYQLFTVTGVDKNIGGEVGIVTYNIGEYLSNGEFPGNYDSENSAGRIIPEKYFPIFESTLKPNSFIKNEQIRYSGESLSIGFVQSWNEKIKQLNVSSKQPLQIGKILEGTSSKTQGEISNVINPKSFVEVGSFSKSENGWITETGLLNDELQRIQDNFYYQNFSYSLKSRVPYDTWEDAVGSLNHTAGFKKFSDYQLESYANVGISTEIQSNVDVTVDIDGFASLNCVYDFDLAKENALFIGSKTFSDEITFSNRILTDYYESVGNRVLTIDDFSESFNSNPRSIEYLNAYRFSLSDIRAQKYVTYVRDRRYSSYRQIMIVTLLHDNNQGYINQYGKIESYSDLGSFDFSIEGSEGILSFYPIKYKVNDYNVTVLSYNLKDNFAGVATTSIGGIVDIETNTVSASSPTTIVGISTSYTSAKILVGIGDNGNYQFDELNLIHDGTNVEFISYGQLTNYSTGSYSGPGLGTYNAYISGSDLKVDFIPNVGVAASVSVIRVAIANTLSSGIGTFTSNYNKFEANTTSIASSTSPIENVIGEYSSDYDGGYFIIQVSDMTNNRHQLSEVLVINDLDETYFTEYANLETHSGLGTVGVGKTTDKTQILFTPLPDIDVQVKVCFNSLSNVATP